jgi:hypothetical protein
LTAENVAFSSHDGARMILCAVTGEALKEWARRHQLGYGRVLDVHWCCYPELHSIVDATYDGSQKSIIITSDQLNH